MQIKKDIQSYPRNELLRARTLLLDPLAPKVFDFDDTIARTNQLQRYSVVQAFATIGKPVDITPEYGATHLRGKTGRDIISTILQTVEGRVDETIVDRLVGLRNNALVSVVNTTDQLSSLLMPGMEDVVRLFRETNQKVAIATQSPEEFVRAFLKRTQVDDRPMSDVFSPTLITGADKIRKTEELFGRTRRKLSLGKPHPIAVVHGAKRVGRNYERALYIGDNEVDARTVAGREDITGVIVNADPARREILRKEFNRYTNIIIVSSFEELVKG